MELLINNMGEANVMYQSVETGLSKAAIFLVIKDNDTVTSHLVTRNKPIINFFDSGFAEIPYSQDLGANTIEAYELRYNRVVNINVTNIHEIYYYGLPSELSPPIFLNPLFQNTINDSMIVESQLSEFLVKVKSERDNGVYQEHPFIERDVTTLYNIKYFLQEEYGITSENTVSLGLFDKYEVFNILSNTVDVNNILSLHTKMFFLPAILECAGVDTKDLKDIFSGIIDSSVFSKTKWIEILESKRSKCLTEYQNELSALKARFETGEDAELNQSEYDSLQKQYHQTIKELTDLSFVDELDLYDDYRLYLRYWPSQFVDAVEFHKHIRPFTALEHRVLRLFLRAGISFDYDSIYRKDFDFYNSVITDLEVHTEAWREYKLKKITEAGDKRAEEIRADMMPLYDNLVQEEKEEFDKALAELTNYERYKSDLGKLTRLTDVMSYWPVALYPVPDDTLRL